MKKFCTHFIIIAITILIIINADSAITYAKSALNICYEIIIPSLFPFFICSGLLIYSGFCESIAKIFRPVMMPLFNINGSGSAAFVLGILSGYPLGAITTCQLYENRYLSQSEAERLLAFCNNSGPLFILGSVGISLYSSPKIGLILYIAHILSSLTVGILFRFYKRNEYNAPTASVANPERSIGEIFTIVMQNSIKSILTICGTILFFSVVSNIIANYINLDYVIKSFIIGIMEFVTGTRAIASAQLDLPIKLILSSVIVGFAGLSVHMQVMSAVSSYELSLKPYIVGKVLHGVLAGLYTWIIYSFAAPVVSVFGNSIPTIELSGGFAVSAFYVMFSVICILLIIISYGVFRLIKEAKELKRSFLNMYK